jgi:phage terminase small subunit
MRGRKPKPTVLKIREGNPGKRAINAQEPTAPAGIPERPAMLQGEAAAEWGRTSTLLHEMGRPCRTIALIPA